MAGEQAAARRALHQALLDQERLDDLLDRVARLRQRRRDGLDPDRAAAVVRRDEGEIAAVHGIEAGAVDLEREQRAVGRSEEHTSELQSLRHLVCRLLLEKK